MGHYFKIWRGEQMDPKTNKKQNSSRQNKKSSCVFSEFLTPIKIENKIRWVLLKKKTGKKSHASEYRHPCVLP
jgi:hypothetical protein